MSQEKILEKNKLYQNKEWLEHQYIELNKTIDAISEEFGYSKTTLTRWKSRFCLCKYNKDGDKNLYQNRDWLYNKFILDNLTAVEIAEECSVNRGTIFEYISKFNLEKDFENKKASYSKRIKDISISQYGVNHYNSSQEVLKKRRQTNLDRYGSETFLGSKKHKELYKDSDKFNFVFGKTAYEWSCDYGITNIIIYRFLKSNPNIKYDEFLFFLKNYKKEHSNIENIVSSDLDIEIYDKYFDLERYPNLRYKPDFKLSDKIALNVDGLYWHSEKIKDDKYYHFKMRKEFEDLGLRIFQFREDEVKDKLNIVRSIIGNATKEGSQTRFYARKTKVCKISQKEAETFLNENHMMGSTKAKHLGLFVGSELVSVMSFREYKKCLKIERFCSKVGHSIVGGFSKLLKNILIDSEKTRVEYWVDLRYGTGDFLSKFGFQLERETLGWKWTDFQDTYNRLSCRANMDDRLLSQQQHAEELGWVKIYDAGQRLYVGNKMEILSGNS